MILKRICFSLLIPIFVIIALSLLTLFSITPEYFHSQLIFVFIGLVFFLAGFFVNYQVYQRFSLVLYIISILMLVLTLLLGRVTRGSSRWLQIGGLQIQTSEFVKPLLILFFSAYLIKKETRKILQILIYLLLLLIPVFLVLRQPDLGSALVLAVLGIALLFAKGLSFKWIIGIFLISVISLPVFWNLLQDYQKNRITAFLNPEQDPLGSGYHLIQSMTAVGSGGFWGKGLGEGTQSQLRFLPERHTDFIFASLAEELGFFGASLLLLSYFFLLFKVLKTSMQAKSRFGSLITIGVFVLFILQILINSGMNLGLLPITGVTLPLMSSGGSSVVSMLFCLGIVANISLEVKKRRVIEIS